MRYFITLSYDGAPFNGWQVQPNAATVQECLESALSTLLGTRLAVTGAGRTDSKVNAIGYVAHFDYDSVIDTAVFGYKLNAILPPGVVIHGISPVEGSGDADPETLPHARFTAKRREYTYFLHRTKDPFVEGHSYFCPWSLDVEAMNEAAGYLLGTHDFSCFEKVGSDNRTSVCTVKEAFWAAYEPSHVALMGYTPACPSPSKAPAAGGTYLYFRISADRFLRNMVRAIVGSLLEVGRGRRTVRDFAALVLPADGSAADARSAAAGGTPLRSLAGESVPGHALFLSRVDY